MLRMAEDSRPISAVLFNDKDGGMYKVGEFGCTKIEVLTEPGQAAYVPWVVVWQGGDISTRIPAWMVQIVYAPPVGDKP